LAIFKLVVAHESDFLWMLGDAEPTRALRLAPGGVAAPQTLRIVQAMTRRLFEAGCDASWLMIDDDEIVGLCSFRRPPLDGRVEIGYGVAGARTGRGFATQAVKAMLALGPRHGVTTFDDERQRRFAAGSRAIGVRSDRRAGRSGGRPRALLGPCASIADRPGLRHE